MIYYDKVEKNASGKVYKLLDCSRQLEGGIKYYHKGTAIFGMVVAQHHNQLVEAILKIEETLGNLNESLDFNEKKSLLFLDGMSMHSALAGMASVPAIGDDSCPDIEFIFNIISTSPSNVAEFCVRIFGSYLSYRLDFGDGAYTTTEYTGTHTYQVGATINPTVTVVSDNCCITQQPVTTLESCCPPAVPNPSVPFHVQIPEVPDFPVFMAPESTRTCPGPLFNLPPLIVPQSCGSGISCNISDISVTIDGRNIPSEISIIGCCPPSVISFVGCYIPEHISVTCCTSVISFACCDIPSTISIVGCCDFLSHISITCCDIPSAISLIGCDYLSHISITCCDIPSQISIVGCDIPSQISIVGCDIPSQISLIGCDFLSNISITCCDIPSQINVVGCNFPSNISVICCDIPSQISIVGGDIPSQISLIGCNFPSNISVICCDIPSQISFVNVPSFSPIGFESPPTISVSWGVPPVVSCIISVQCCSSTPCSSSLGFAETPMGFAPTEIVADIGIPSEIKVIVPKIPEFIYLNAEDLPESIRLDASEVPTTIILKDNLPKFIELRATGIPDSISVVGMPSTIEVKLVMPENPFIEMVYRGNPIDLNLNLDISKELNELILVKK